MLKKSSKRALWSWHFLILDCMDKKIYPDYSKYNIPYISYNVKTIILGKILRRIHIARLITKTIP